MKPTTVKTEDLLDRLNQNRTKHEADFKAAKKVWVQKCTKALEKAAKKAKTGRIDEYPLVNLPKPKHYLNSYDTMIARLEAEVNDEVELDDRDFQAYWLDNWGWKGDFVGTNSLYSA